MQSDRQTLQGLPLIYFSLSQVTIPVNSRAKCKICVIEFQIKSVCVCVCVGVRE